MISYSLTLKKYHQVINRNHHLRKRYHQVRYHHLRSPSSLLPYKRFGKSHKRYGLKGRQRVSAEFDPLMEGQKQVDPPTFRKVLN